jgi:hypothetical protein
VRRTFLVLTGLSLLLPTTATAQDPAAEPATAQPATPDAAAGQGATTTTTATTATAGGGEATGTTAEAEQAGRSRGGYAWGEGAVEDTPTAPAYHRYNYFTATLGFGGTIRILAHAEICDPGIPGREGCRFSPPYAQLRGIWGFEADGLVQHGVGVGIATNLGPDGTGAVGLDALTQYAFTPAYHIRLWIDPWFQVNGHFGVPLVMSAVTGSSIDGTEMAFNWGAELQLGAVFKFLQGLGIYAAANVAMFFATTGAVWPTVSFEGGLVFDYEVLP